MISKNHLQVAQLCLLFLIIWGCTDTEPSEDKDIYTAVFRHNAEHTGVYDTPAPKSDIHPRWIFTTDGPVRSAPVIADGAIYFGSGDGYVYSISETSGEVNWKVKTGGAVHSTPALAGGLLYVTSRDRHIYAIGRNTGEVIWRTETGALLPLDWGFDYYLSSPVVKGSTVYAGAGDGYLYALNRNNGSVQWKLETEGRIRSALTIHENTGFIGNLAGRFYALDLEDGDVQWTFDIEGAAMDGADFGFDRSGILSSAVYAAGKVVFGGRDGYVYCLDAVTGEQLWRNNHEISWAISSMAYTDGKIITGTSDGRFVQAIEVETGEELWRTETRGAVWSSPAVAEGVAYFGDSASDIFAVDIETGERIWTYLAGDRVWATAVVKDTTVYIGSDDGRLYALTGSVERIVHSNPARVVYTDSEGSTDEHERIARALVQEGYEAIDDETQLNRFLSDYASPDSTSVVVMATASVAPSIPGDNVAESALKQYLDNGGKIVWLGRAPFLVRFEDQERQAELNRQVFHDLLNIDYHFDGRGFMGIYPARVSGEGLRWGLQTGWWVGYWLVDADQVTTVLATDEYGHAAAWVKNMGGMEGTGFVRLVQTPRLLNDIPSVKAVAEYGLYR